MSWKNQVCILQKSNLCFKESSLRFKESSLRFAEIKFGFQRIKFAFCRNQVCVSKNKDHVSKNQVLFHRIKFHRVESSCCVVRMISIVHRINELWGSLWKQYNNWPIVKNLPIPDAKTINLSSKTVYYADNLC